MYSIKLNGRCLVSVRSTLLLYIILFVQNKVIVNFGISFLFYINIKVLADTKMYCYLMILWLPCSGNGSSGPATYLFRSATNVTHVVHIQHILQPSFVFNLGKKLLADTKMYSCLMKL